MPESLPTQPAFWRQPLPELCRVLDAAPAGLSSAEAAARLKNFGPNLLRPARRGALFRLFFSRFRNPLVIVLLVASGISALTGETASFWIIVAMVLMSVCLDTVQEYRAGQAAERLKQSVAVRAAVLRDGRRIEVPIFEVVPGDVTLLAAGDSVPADGRLLEARDFFVNQALLTGEPYPVEKHAVELAQGEGLEAAANAVLMGTSVISGSATVLVCRTGPATSIGEIADTLITKAPPTSFERGARQFGMLIMRLTVLLVLFVLLVNTVFHRPLLESFLFAIALAVGLTPELLPMIVSITLSRGAIRMARKQVIVKRLASIQDLGGMDVLCTDKTGTLTEARIKLERHVDALGRDSEHVLRLAYLNSYFETGLKSPLDDAILAHGEIDVGAWRKIDEVPFDFERRRVSVLVDDGTSRLLAVKGAPEDILALCTAYEADPAETPVPFDDASRERVDALFRALGQDGFRVLGIAWRRVPLDHPHAVVSDETELVFAGFAAFLDPPKASAADAIADLAESGVAVKIVTGDNELVTRHVCTQLGLPIAGVLTGAEVQKMDDFALQAAVEGVNLFCRVTPTQKNRVILALKARGHVVGYLGDGINDAPPLHSADVGISVDGAVDVAKEAADMILLEHDLNVLRDSIEEGRRSSGNVLKYIMMGTSSNFGNMFSMAGATLIIPFLPMLPVQILLNNLLYDVSEIAIPLDNVDQEYLARPQEWDMAFIRNFMWVVGSVSSIFDFLTFWVMLELFHAGEALFRTGWFVESMATQVLVIFVIRTRFNPFASQPHPLLTGTSLAVVAVAAALPFTPFGSALGLVPLPAGFFGVLAAMVVVYLLAVEGVKRWFYLRLARR